MFYVTGDTHGDFKRFAKRERMKLPFVLGEDDYVIVCGDFGILWNKKDKESAYDKIIHLMRGQVFYIEGKKIFTFGGASSHDIQGGILDKSDKNYDLLRKKR